MKELKKWAKKRWFSNALAACIAISFYLIVSNCPTIFNTVRDGTLLMKPVILGIVFAYLVNPICVFMERKIFKKIRREGLRHSVSVVAGVCVVIIVFVIFLLSVVTQVVGSVVSLLSNAGDYAFEVKKLLPGVAEIAQTWGIDVTGLIDSIYDMINDFLEDAPGQAKSILKTSYNIGTSVADVLIGAILAVYLLMDKQRMLRGVDRLMQAMVHPQRYRDTKVFLRRCNDILISYIGFDLLDGLIIGVVNFLFMSIMQMPYAVLVSVIVGLTNLAPTFGPIVGAIAGSFVLLLDRPVNVVIFLIFTLILQGLDGYVIKPRLFGSTLGVPAVWILIALVIGAKLYGVLGILLGIPLAAILRYIYESFLDKRIEARKRMQIAKEEPAEPAKE